MRDVIQEMNITVTRDSVCMGDDVVAPHEKEITIPDVVTLSQLATSVLAKYDLAKISGGKATWVMKAGNKSVAIVAQQWKEPKLLKEDRLIRDLSEIHFEYLEQKSPESVYENLKG